VVGYSLGGNPIVAPLTQTASVGPNPHPLYVKKPITPQQKQKQQKHNLIIDLVNNITTTRPPDRPHVPTRLPFNVLANQGKPLFI
jgi:hypothetical protein